MKIALYFIIALSLAIGFNLWLDAGCDLSGVITWEGKQCIDL